MTPTFNSDRSMAFDIMYYQYDAENNLLLKQKHHVPLKRPTEMRNELSRVRHC